MAFIDHVLEFRTEEVQVLEGGVMWATVDGIGELVGWPWRCVKGDRGTTVLIEAQEASSVVVRVEGAEVTSPSSLFDKEVPSKFGKQCGVPLDQLT